MLTIRPMTAENADYLNRVDTRYLAGDLVQIRVTRKGFLPEYVPVASASWQTYQPPRGLRELLAAPTRQCFFAFWDEQFAGQLALSKGEYGLVDLIDLQVDARSRRQSIATALLDAGVDWAQGVDCHGLRAQTTDQNPVACQFFEHTGFQLGGVDRLRFCADRSDGELAPGLKPSALTFYRFF